jgi:hypothetical protein
MNPVRGEKSPPFFLPTIEQGLETGYASETRQDQQSHFIKHIKAQEGRLLPEAGSGHCPGSSRKVEETPARQKMRSKNVPTNKALYARVKAEAKRRFTVYPSIYANAWLVREYKKRGGKYRAVKVGT